MEQLGQNAWTPAKTSFARPDHPCPKNRLNNKITTVNLRKSSKFSPDEPNIDTPFILNPAGFEQRFNLSSYPVFLNKSLARGLCGQNESALSFFPGNIFILQF